MHTQKYITQTFDYNTTNSQTQQTFTLVVYQNPCALKYHQQLTIKTKRQILYPKSATTKHQLHQQNYRDHKKTEITHNNYKEARRFSSKNSSCSQPGLPAAT